MLGPMLGGWRAVRRSHLAQDVALSTLVVVMQVQGTLGRVAADPATVERALSEVGGLGFALLVISGAALVLRRCWPAPVFAVTVAASFVYYGLDFPDGPGWVSLFVATYTLTAQGDGRRSIVTSTVGISVLSIGWLIAAADVEPRAAIGWVFFRIGASVMSAALGESVRSRRVIAVQALQRAAEAEQTREATARARVDQERLRIAREVHDTVAHALAVINVQAGVTAHVLDRQPELTRDALRAIETTSGRALSDLRMILGVLRADDSREPQPGLTEVPELAASARRAGLDVRCTVGERSVTVPSVIGGAVYRIVQESLTNVLRHVGPTRVDITLTYDADHVEVTVVDAGRSSPTPPASGGAANGPRAVDDRDGGPGGHGLFGMRERCNLLGGEFAAGPAHLGGFVVRARLPLRHERLQHA